MERKPRVPKLVPATTASEVIANALVYWGKGGKRWVAGTLGSLNEGVCFYGGLSVGAFGSELVKEDEDWELKVEPAYSYQLSPRLADTPEAAAYKKAEKFVLDELEARGFEADIVEFNDSDNGGAVVLEDLQNEIESLTAEIRAERDKGTKGSLRQELREKRALYRAQKKALAAAPPGTFKGVKAIACGALKRALEWEEQEAKKKGKHRAA